MKGLFSSEYVSPGHPDMVADTIAAYIVQEYLDNDKDAHCGIEVLVAPNSVVVAGEVKSSYQMSFDQLNVIVRKAVTDCGYTRPGVGFNAADLEITSYVHEQSPDIAQGVEGVGDKEVNDKRTGSGDQGIMSGYAVNESPNYMPWTHFLARSLCLELFNYQKENDSILRPDIKTQITINYDTKIPTVDTILVSASHDESASIEEVRTLVKSRIDTWIAELSNIFPPESWCLPGFDSYKLLINPTGKFAIYGPNGDSGITGRKLTVNTYGGRGYHGGGAFFNKDYTKTDMSALVAARWVAKNIVWNNFADEVDVQLAYAIGVPDPVSINVDCKGTQKVDLSIIKNFVDSFDLSVDGIINGLCLKECNYHNMVFTGVFYGPYSWEEKVTPKGLK